MLGNSTVSSASKIDVTESSSKALFFLTLLFFMWGFITCLNDILIPHLKQKFDLSYTQSMLIQFCFFGAYFLMSIPAGILVNKIGFKKSIVFGLVLSGFGSLLFIPASLYHQYSFFLLALFVLASGITVLQVSANPLVTLIGPEKSASSRLTMTQAFNSLGTTIAPMFGAFLILGAVSNNADGLDTSLIFPYTLIAFFLFIIGAAFSLVNLPEKNKHTQKKGSINFPVILRNKQLLLGALGIFLYVGAEVSIGSFMISYFSDLHNGEMAESQAAKYVTLYWGGAMVGRFLGIFVLRKYQPGGVLFVHCALTVTLLAITLSSGGSIAMWSLVLVGLFNSIMFPTIFSLALRGLKEHTASGSSLLCLCIAGGAIMPMIQGVVADLVTLKVAFVVPLVCYLYIAFYGALNRKQ